MRISDAFPHLDQNEKTMLVLRKHPLVLLKPLAKGFLMLLVPPIIYIVVSILSNGPEFPEGSIIPYLAILGVSVFYLYLLLFLFVYWLKYYLDVWIVTTERVINIDQRQLFSRRVSEVRLAQIQDCTVEVVGMTRTFFKFGDINLQTAAEQNEFTFKNIRNPDNVQGIILKLMKENQENKTVIINNQDNKTASEQEKSSQ